MSTSASRYVSKKLQPFITQKEELEIQYAKLLKEHEEEERLNDKYFDELGQWERLYDTQLRTLDDQNKKNSNTKTTEVSSQAQDVDARIENAVVRTLTEYLLTKSKKESLESLQSREIEKRQAACNLTLGKPNEVALKDDDEENAIEKDEYGYFITVRAEGKTMNLKIPATLKTFKDLKVIVKSCFMLEENEIFCTDQMGNLFQENMNILNELYPPLYDLMKNYQPVVGIQIVKPVILKEQIQSGDESLMSDDQGKGATGRRYKLIKKPDKKINWNAILGYINTAKFLFEVLLFFFMMILYVSLEIDSVKFTTSSQLLLAFKQSFQLSQSYIQPIINISTIINQTISFSNDTTIMQTYPLKSGLIVQTLVLEEKLEDCLILNDNQKQLFIDKNQSCLNFDEIQTTDLEGNYTVSDFDPSKYNSAFGGYVWELDLSTKENFDNNVNLLLEENWKKYNRKSSKFIINYYNSPTKRLMQVIITTIFLFSDLYLNYNTIELQAFDLNEQTDSEILFNNILFYLAIILLSLSMFDFFGIYLVKSTTNNLINIYQSYSNLKIKQRKLLARKRELTPIEQQQLQQQELIVDEYFVIKLPIIYLVIKVPLIFDIIYILSNIAIIVRSQIQQIHLSAINSIDVHSEKYQDVSQLITPVYAVRIFTGIIILFLMTSIIRFLGNWSPYLKCYGLVMIRFNKQSSFLLIILVFLISISAMSWSITIQGKLMGQENFFYDFIGILRCTLKYGMHNDNADLGLENNYQKDISFSFETRYIQYLIIIVVTFIMVPIFISLMTQQVHNTKIEAKQKMIEIKKENKEKQ